MTNDLRNRIIWLVLFSIAMGFLETAVVVYLRELYYPDGFSFLARVVGASDAAYRRRPGKGFSHERSEQKVPCDTRSYIATEARAICLLATIPGRAGARRSTDQLAPREPFAGRTPSESGAGTRIAFEDGP